MTVMPLAAACAALAILSMPAGAQTHGDPRVHAHPPAAATPLASPPASPYAGSPYAGMERRAVKALSDEQIADLRAGRGMALALAAELNGYPGPMHVLELADALQLSSAERARTAALVEAMRAETIAIGERIVAEETALDRLFAERRVTPATLDAATARIGAAQASLRAAHLRTHLAMMEILSPAQVAHYQTLRGYDR
jgi:hypothetical protein